jgi:hypothetical protein
MKWKVDTSVFMGDVRGCGHKAENIAVYPTAASRAATLTRAKISAS